jgi:hypothetical protein
MIKKYLFALIALGCFARSADAQGTGKRSFGDRIYFGGNFGLSFGSYSSEVELSPIIGYKITERLSGGVGLTYIYFRSKDPYTHYTYETNIYGGDVFARYFVTENLFAYVETGGLNLDVPSPFYPYRLSKQWVQDFLIGGGYSSQMGEFI